MPSEATEAPPGDDMTRAINGRMGRWLATPGRASVTMTVTVEDLNTLAFGAYLDGFRVGRDDGLREAQGVSDPDGPDPMCRATHVPGSGAGACDECRIVRGIRDDQTRRLHEATMPGPPEVHPAIEW